MISAGVELGRCDLHSYRIDLHLAAYNYLHYIVKE